MLPLPSSPPCSSHAPAHWTLGHQEAPSRSAIGLRVFVLVLGVGLTRSLARCSQKAAAENKVSPWTTQIPLPPPQDQSLEQVHGRCTSTFGLTSHPRLHIHFHFTSRSTIQQSSSDSSAPLDLSPSLLPITTCITTGTLAKTPLCNSHRPKPGHRAFAALLSRTQPNSARA